MIQDLGKSLQHPPPHPRQFQSQVPQQMGSLRRPPGAPTGSLLPEAPEAPGHMTRPHDLTAAMVALVEYAIGACEIVDKLVLPNEEGALSGDGVEDGGSEAGLGAVEGSYPATVNAQLQRSRTSVNRWPWPQPTCPALGRGTCSDNCLGGTHAVAPRVPSLLTLQQHLSGQTPPT